MTDIRVFERFGPVCVDSEDGARLGEQVRAALDRGETVCLDFAGVTTLASAFLGPAVGRLYAHFDKGDLERRLVWKGLDPVDESMLRHVRRNAILFYSADPSVREALLSSSVRAAEA